MHYANNIVVITGAGSGLGRAYALEAVMAGIVGRDVSSSLSRDNYSAAAWATRLRQRPTAQL